MKFAAIEIGALRVKFLYFPSFFLNPFRPNGLFYPGILDEHPFHLLYCFFVVFFFEKRTNFSVTKRVDPDQIQQNAAVSDCCLRCLLMHKRRRVNFFYKQCYPRQNA